MRIHTLDLHFQNEPQIIAAYLVECGKELALIETGPGSTLNSLQDAIRGRGFQPDAVKHVFVTHVHLDHAGAAGWWAQQGATIFAHPKAAPHLVDPSKLMDSAKRVYGDQMGPLWGEMLPVPADRIVTLNDGQEVKIGDIAFTAIDTPGHARHHHAYACEGVCFTGDVAGMRLPNCDYLSVTAAPPQFDPVAYSDSLNRLNEGFFDSLFLAHFGEVQDVRRHLATYALRVEQVFDCVQKLLADGLRGDALRTAYREAEHAVALKYGLSEEDWPRYELGNSTSMSAGGIALFCEKAGK